MEFLIRKKKVFFWPLKSSQAWAKIRAKMLIWVCPTCAYTFFPPVIETPIWVYFYLELVLEMVKKIEIIEIGHEMVKWQH